MTTPLPALLVLSAVLAPPALEGARDDQETSPQPAITFLVEAFDRHDLVALSESHDSATQHGFLQELLRDPGFRAVCKDIVVEFASARHQATLDRYLAGEEVPFDELAPVWRDTPVSPYQTWDSPVYAAFLATVRELNQGVSEEDRLRVWASEEPIAWEAISSAEEHHPYLERSTFPARVTWERCLSKSRKTLLLRGGGHLARLPVRPGLRTVVQILVEDHGVEPLTIALWSDREGALPDVEQRLADWPRRSIASLRGTWLGALPASRVLTFRVRGPDGTWGPPYPGVRMDELYDAYLYLGPSSELEDAPADPSAYGDAYQQELARRRALFEPPK
jgi:hypothetical protein